jgi:hypothetical protein
MELNEQLPDQSLASTIGNDHGNGYSPPAMGPPPRETGDDPETGHQESLGIEPVSWEFSGMHPKDDLAAARKGVDYGTSLRGSVGLPVVPKSMTLPHLFRRRNPVKECLSHASRVTQDPNEWVDSSPVIEVLPSPHALFQQINDSAEFKQGNLTAEIPRWTRRRELPSHPALSRRTLDHNHFKQCTARKPIASI